MNHDTCILYKNHLYNPCMVCILLYVVTHALVGLFNGTYSHTHMVDDELLPRQGNA